MWFLYLFCAVYSSLVKSPLTLRHISSRIITEDDSRGFTHVKTVKTCNSLLSLRNQQAANPSQYVQSSPKTKYIKRDNEQGNAESLANAFQDIAQMFDSNNFRQKWACLGTEVQVNLIHCLMDKTLEQSTMDSTAMTNVHGMSSKPTERFPLDLTDYKGPGYQKWALSKASSTANLLMNEHKQTMNKCSSLSIISDISSILADSRNFINHTGFDTCLLALKKHLLQNQSYHVASNTKRLHFVDSEDYINYTGFDTCLLAPLKELYKNQSCHFPLDPERFGHISLNVGPGIQRCKSFISDTPKKSSLNASSSETSLIFPTITKFASEYPWQRDEPLKFKFGNNANKLKTVKELSPKPPTTDRPLLPKRRQSFSKKTKKVL